MRLTQEYINRPRDVNWRFRVSLRPQLALWFVGWLMTRSFGIPGKLSSKSYAPHFCVNRPIVVAGAVVLSLSTSRSSTAPGNSASAKS